MLYLLNSEDKTDIKPITQKTFANIGWKEKELENLLAQNMPKLIPQNQLMVLFQEKPFGEEADIFALDRNGDLYIFELKRWQAHEENILQVLRYGQIYGQYDYEQLQNMLEKYTKSNELNLAQKHYEYFEESIASKLKESDFNKQQHFVLITNGTDVDSRNAIKYWQDKGLSIDSIIYWVYEIGGQHVFEFDPYNPEREVIVEQEEGNFIVNTNLTWSKTDYKAMLGQSMAAAYGNNRNMIKRIKKGDTVFLYHNVVGIIAYGKTQSGYKSLHREGTPDDVYFSVPVKFEWVVNPDTEPEKAVKAWEIKKKLSRQYAFRQTVFAISREMSKAIKEIAKTKDITSLN